MPDGVLPSQMADVALSVIQAQPLGQNFDYLYAHDCPRSFELMKQLFPKGGDIQVGGGQEVANYVTYREYGTAAFVLPGQTYQPGIINVMKKASVGWAHTNSHWSVLDHEMLDCRDEEMLINFLGPRRAAAQVDQAMLIENELWAAYDSASETQPRTLPYYITPIDTLIVGDAGAYGNTDVAGAFQGGNASGASDTNGIDPGLYVDATGWDDETYKRWRNYNFQWSNSSGIWTDTDAERLGWAMDYMGFEAPPNATKLDDPQFSSRRLYTNKVTRQSTWRAAGQQNDQIGPDLAQYQGSVLFRMMPFIWQIQLDTYSAARGYFPTYLVNWNHIKPICKRGRVFLERPFAGDRYQPDTTTTHNDTTYQVWCHNRQLVGAVGSYVAGT